MYVCPSLFETFFCCFFCALWTPKLTHLAQTDDVGFFCSPVSNEYLLAAQHFGLGRTDLLDIATKSVDAIFGGEQEKMRIKGKLLKFASN